MRRNRPVLFRGRHFEDQIIVLCVRWYLSYSLSYRDLEQMMAERNLSVDHSTIARWVLRYAPELNKRIRHELRNPNRSDRAHAPTSETRPLVKVPVRLSPGSRVRRRIRMPVSPLCITLPCAACRINSSSPGRISLAA